ncbi:MAG TPA: DUF1887 family CARF protein [Candidatus Ozemobacteraceae bacterium]|nr:DUF1887 family CARF protein [Candidatus Ozemobacteraceae bacterium]
MTNPSDFYVALIGEQTLPNLLPALAVKPRVWWFVYSEDRFMQQEIRWITHFWREYHKGANPMVKPIRVDPFSPDAISRALHDAWVAEGRPRGVVNVTGGTKLMSLGAFTFAGKAGQAVIYYRGDRLYSLNPETPLSQEGLSIPRLSPHELLLAYGKYADTTIRQRVPTANQVEAARRLGSKPAAASILASWIKCHAHGQRVTNLSDHNDRQAVADAELLLQAMEKLGLLRTTWVKGSQVPQIKIIDEDFWGKHTLGAWLEIYVTDVARRVFGAAGVASQCQLTWERDPATRQPLQDSPKTEADVLIAHENRLSYVSCKCDGQAGKDFTLSKELLSIDATARALGGALARRILVTNADLSKKLEVRTKARIMRIDLIDRHDLPNLEAALKRLLIGGAS